MVNHWHLTKKELKEALVKHCFSYPDDNLDWYDVSLHHDGSVELKLNSKGVYHYTNTSIK